MTELLFALGLGERVVGVTTFCDHPEEAKMKPKIGGMSNPSLEAIVSLKPDIVVMTTDGNPQEVEVRLRSLGIMTYVWKARTIAELPQGVRDLGGVVDAVEKAEVLSLKIESSLRKGAGVRGQGRGISGSSLVSRPLSRKKVLFIVWPEPLIVAGPGTAIDDAIVLLGCDNIASGARSSYPKYSIEEVIRQAPDALFIGRGSGMDMRAVSKDILKRLESAPAVRNGKVFFVGDGLYRLGPRIPQGIEELAKSLMN
jgi:iron complex transport system substrate-binding protein